MRIGIVDLGNLVHDLALHLEQLIRLVIELVHDVVLHPLELVNPLVELPELHLLLVLGLVDVLLLEGGDQVDDGALVSDGHELVDPPVLNDE